MDAGVADGRSEAMRARAELRADRFTALIRDCWYVAGWSTEFGQKPISRRILNRNICLYRAEDGTPVALHDRCPHRSMPLSRGFREGDSLRCGYHGLLFDRTGTCLEAPSQEIKPPKSLCVQTFPVAERGPLVWIWTGDPALVDETKIPDHAWMSDPRWVYAHGSIHLDCNYVGLHENLLDVTHFAYLHPGSTTPEFIKAEVETEVDGDHVRGRRLIASADVPEIYIEATGINGKKISREIVSEFVSPAMHRAHQRFTVVDPSPGSRAEFNFFIVHFSTPESQDSTHYFFAHGRDFAISNEQITELVKRNAIGAFLEDASALEAIKNVQDAELGYDEPEHDIRADQPAIAMRQVLKRIAAREPGGVAERNSGLVPTQGRHREPGP